MQEPEAQEFDDQHDSQEDQGPGQGLPAQVQHETVDVRGVRVTTGEMNEGKIKIVIKVKRMLYAYQFCTYFPMNMCFFN